MTKKIYKNKEIPYACFTVIDEDGKCLGLMKKNDAIVLARDKNRDLVLISESEPVCKIADFDRYRYEMQKRSKRIQKIQPSCAIKTVQIRLGIARHDMEVKAQNIKKMLQKGNKVDIVLFLRGRELSRKENYVPLMEEFVGLLNDVSVVDAPLKQEGNKMIVRLRQKKNSK